MKKEKIYAQHGDVILYETDSIPEGAKKIVIKNGFIVEKGEGVHTHSIPEVKDMEAYEKDGILYLKTNIEEIPLAHEEHKVITIQPNKILFKEIENEFDYEEMEARKTRD